MCDGDGAVRSAASDAGREGCRIRSTHRLSALRGVGSSVSARVGRAERCFGAGSLPFVCRRPARCSSRAGGLACGRARFSPLRCRRSGIRVRTGTRAALVGPCWRWLLRAVAGRALGLGLGERRAGALDSLAAQWWAALAGRGTRGRRGLLELERDHAGIGARAAVSCARPTAPLHEVAREVALPIRGYCISKPA